MTFLSKEATFMKRPWGWMVRLVHFDRFWIRLVWVTPGKRTSKQLHCRRTEYHIHIPKFWNSTRYFPYERHRMDGGLYLEIAFGEPREDDIVTFQDDYGRPERGRIVAVSGGFDPVHIGHVRMFREAKKLAGTDGKLVVILNSDAWLERKKGKGFMLQDDRKEIVMAFGCVDEVYIHESERNDVSEALEIIKPHIFANGGDRREEADIPEAEVCKRNGIEMLFNIGGGKVRSSSELLSRYGRM